MSLSQGVGVMTRFAWVYWLGVFFLTALHGCVTDSTYQDVEDPYDASSEALVANCGGTVRYPTTERDFNRLYAQRVFLASGGPGAHLGRDIAYRVDESIYPIMCGRIVYYGPASGYGTLVVAIEHTLNRAISVTSGDGRKTLVTTFLSIYGHLMAATPDGVTQPWRNGDMVTTQDRIGVVQTDALNGDGAEHLHLGIRLQSASEAQRVDGRYWMRGYDSNPSKRRFFADPAIFLYEVMQFQRSILSHPAGSYLIDPLGNRYVVSANGSDLHAIEPLTAEQEGFTQRPLLITEQEKACYFISDEYRPRFRQQPGSVPFVGRSQYSPVVYLFYGDRQNVYHRDAFVSWEALLSHGYTADNIGWFDETELASLRRLYPVQGIVRMQEGSLVKARGAPAVYVVSNGRRRPIYNWNTFQAFGYSANQIYEIDADALNDVAGPLGTVLRLEDALACPARGI